MSPLHRRSLLALLLTAALPARAQVLFRPQVGAVSSLQGEASAQYQEDEPRVLVPSAPLLLEDTITTGSAARLVGLLEGGIEIRLGEQTSLRIDKLTLKGPQAGIALNVFDGPILFDRPRGEASVPTTVDLPWARIGVRGTRFFAGPLDGRHAVFVEHGRIEVAAGGSIAILTDGDGVDMENIGAPPGPVKKWGAPRIARAMALVGPL